MIISEQEFEYNKEPNNILKELFENGKIENNNFLEGIIMHYYGNKSQIPIDDSLKKWNDQDENKNPLSPDDPKNYLIYMKYKNIYIGSISINDINIREGFGLNVYKENCLYIGQWKDNMKHGIGFFKINKNKMYIGNFKNNQLNGFGILYDKYNENLFYGNFNMGKYENGIFYNEKKNIFYRGKVHNSKKNDQLCTFFDANKGYMFIGEILDDVYNKGYIAFCNINDEKEIDTNEIITKFDIEKSYYFNGADAVNRKYINGDNFSQDFSNLIYDTMNNIFQADFNLKDQNELLFEYFNWLEEITNNYELTQNVEKYCSFDNENSFENQFVSQFMIYVNSFHDSQEALKLNEHVELMQEPEISSKSVVSI